MSCLKFLLAPSIVYYEKAETLVGDDRFSSVARLKAIGFFGMPENFEVPKIQALFETTYFAGLRKAEMPVE
jgi:hypothetical protein